MEMEAGVFESESTFARLALDGPAIGEDTDGLAAGCSRSSASEAGGRDDDFFFGFLTEGVVRLDNFKFLDGLGPSSSDNSSSEIEK